MDYKVKKLEKSQVEIKVTVSKEIMEEAEKKAADEISKDVKVKGFRPGHVPPHVLEQYVDKKYIEAHAQEMAIQKSYAEVVVTEKIQVVSRPKVKIDSEDPLTYTATVAVLPEVEIKDYKSIKVDKKEPKVTDKDIQEVVDDLKKYGTKYKDVDRAAKKGDRVEVDFEGFDKDGKSLEGTKSSNHPVILGGDSLIPGFEDEIVGLKKDEKKEFDITFPKDYGKEDFQGKKVKFKVEVKRIEEAEEPEVNDALIEQVTGKKQKLEDFKKDIEKNVKARKEEEEGKRQENEYIEKLLKATKVDIPEALIEEEAEYIMHDMKHDVVQKGLNWEDFLKQSNTKEEDLKKKYRPEAERRIKVRLALRHVIEEEKLEATDKELMAELEKVKNFYPPAEHEKIMEQYESGELKAQLTNKITLGKLFDKVLK
ncbi:trigger factor [Candidatus Peregrinibacteria bacterium]|jgi:trigger factor|nr:trigger factor [Candidatus Peregrinibacteria bacterium]MBT7736301.1 trigger factor [Candidatus Peregrinibacteria bacterium]